MRHDDDTTQQPPAIEVEQRSLEHDDQPRRAVPAWLLSGAVHGVALGLMSLIVYATTPEIDEAVVRPIHLPPQEVVIIDKKVDTPLIDPNPIEVDTEEIIKPTPQTLLEPDDLVTSMESDVVSEIPDPPGRPDAASSSEMGDVGMLPAIGPGNTAPGMKGRYGPGQQRSTAKWSPGPNGIARRNTIDRALRWFKRHQSPNGQWDVDGYQANCQDAGAKCEPGSEHTGVDGDLACTAYAVLCYLGAGHDHRMPGKYKKTVQQGLDWLVAQQKADGLWGDRNYEHSIVTMALAEAYGMSQDTRLREPAQKGIAMILARQAKDAKDGGYGLGWDYAGPNPARNDASVSGWNVMALKSAKASGLDIGNGLKDSGRYLERAWKAANPGVDPRKLDPYTGTSVFPYVWNAETGAVQVEPGGKQHDLSCVGAICAVFLGHKADDPVLNSLANHIDKTQYPTAYPTNTYYLYYNAMVMFQMGPKRFEKWNQPIATMLQNAQRGEACFDGSWDYEGTVFHGHQTGRLLSTAYACLTLEVIYRWQPIAAEIR